MGPMTTSTTTFTRCHTCLLACLPVRPDVLPTWLTNLKALTFLDLSDNKLYST